jgi:tRNA modification GTPase
VDGSAAGERDLASERAALPVGVPLILVWNKADLSTSGAAGVRTSAATGEGLEDLEEAAARALELESSSGAEHARELFVRHHQCLREAREAIVEAGERLADGTPLDLVAEALRAAGGALDGIHGETTPEDVLDRIFARFCLGK